MSNNNKDINIKNWINYFFNDIISIKNFDSSNIKIHKKSDKNILIYLIGHVTIKKDLKTDSVNPLYLSFSKLEEYFEVINENKYLRLAPTNESKGKIKKYEGIKIRDLIRSII